MIFPATIGLISGKLLCAQLIPLDNNHGEKPADAADESAAPQVLECLVRLAEQAQASDIHLHLRGDDASVVFRLDGVMTPVSHLPASLAERGPNRKGRLPRHREGPIQEPGREQFGARSQRVRTAHFHRLKTWLLACAPHAGFGMARKLRQQYPGATYHVMNRRDRRESIFLNDQGRRLLVETLAEACQKTGW